MSEVRGTEPITGSRLAAWILWAAFVVLVVVQLLSHVWLFSTPRTAARQASLSFTISRSLLKLISIESVMSSNHLILCFLLLLLPSKSFPALGSFPVSQLFTSGGQSIGASSSASVLLMNIQGWFPLGLTGLIWPSSGLSRVFSSTTVRKASILWRSAFFIERSHYEEIPNFPFA